MSAQGGTRARTGRTAEPALVGRDALLYEVQVAAREAVRGRGTLFLLTGEAGIGKTSVVRELTRDDLGLRVTSGRCAADAGAPPFWPWRELVDIDQALPSERVPPVADDGTGGSRFQLLTRLADDIVATASARPTLHVIEDLQWADVASVLLLGHLGAAIERAPLCLLATLRTGETVDATLETALGDVRAQARLRDLRPLGADDVEAMARAQGLPDPRLAAAVTRRTGGQPLFVAELLRVVAGEPGPDARLAAVAERVPSRVSELIGDRLGRLPTPVSEVLTTAAVLGHDGDLRTLATTHGCDVDQVLELLDQARAAHLIEVATGRWQFRHQIVRDAVYARPSLAERRRRHGRAVDALADDPATPPSVLAAHAIAALPLFDADRAVALAARAGESAFAQLAYEEAVGWFDDALLAAPSTSSPRWRAELLLLSAEAHRHLGATEPAQRAFRAAAELVDDPVLAARAALGYANPGADLGIAFRSDDPVTRRLLERAIACQPAGDSPTTALLEARLAAELYFSDEPGAARTIATRAVERARRIHDPRALGAAAAVYHDAFVVGQAPLEEQLRGSEQLRAWAQGVGTPAALLTAHRARVFDLLAAGDIAALDTEIVAFRRIADPLRVPAYTWWPELWAAMRALLEGRHDDAETLALRAHRTGARPFASLSFLNLSFLLFFLRREQGRLAEMEHATREFTASHADVPALRVGLIFLLSEVGHVDEASGLLADIDARALDRLRDRNWPATWFQLARSAMITGDETLARRLLEPSRRPTERCVMVSLASVCLGASDLATAWLHHALGDSEDAHAHYEAAQHLNARIGARSWLTQARVDHAHLLLDRDHGDDRDAARRLLGLAAPAARSIGMAPAVDEIDRLQARLGAAPAEVSDRSSRRRGTFRNEGETWRLEFSGRAVRVSDARGLRDLALLLQRPGEQLSVRELVAAEQGGAPSAARGAPAFDDRARREIRDRLRDLEAEIDDAESVGDGERAALAREQRQALAEAVAKDLGRRGKPRLVGDPAERARKTVSTRIRRAIAHVARAHPELGRHLDRSIDTGAWCSYQPPEPVSWTT